jgi:hypothetical protein
LRDGNPNGFPAQPFPVPSFRLGKVLRLFDINAIPYGCTFNILSVNFAQTGKNSLGVWLLRTLGFGIAALNVNAFKLGS